jgi:lipopolysaccharide transport system ATP-binding protein
MSQGLAIRAEGLSKSYRIGARPRHDTLADTLGGLIRPSAWARRAADRHGELVWALRDVAFEVPAGAAVGIIGRNGSGKTTLLKLLAGITEPTAGRVELRGRVGALLEVGTGFHAELTGRENVYLSGAILGMRRSEIARSFDAIAAFSGVERFLDTPVKHYSSGMYLRLAFAVAAHLEPEILLVDEVLAVGDAEFQNKCMGKMDDVAHRGRTILFVSHNLAAVHRLCATGMLLDGGRLVAAGRMADVIRAYTALLEAGEAPADGGVAQVCGLRAEPPDLEAGKPAAFNFVLAVRGSLSRLSVRLSIRNAEDDLVVHTRMPESEAAPLLRPGSHDVHVTLPPFWLIPGMYSVQVKALGDGPGNEGVRAVSDPLAVAVTSPVPEAASLPGHLAVPGIWDVRTES